MAGKSGSESNLPGIVKTAPWGKKNSAKGLKFQSAIKKALASYESDTVAAGHALDAIGRRLVKEALTSDDPAMVKFAITEIGNRLDGKAREHKVVDQSITTDYAGLSKAVGILRKFAGLGETYTLEGAVPDRPLLPVEVCVEPEGHGAGVGVPEVPGGSGGPERSD